MRRLWIPIVATVCGLAGAGDVSAASSPEKLLATALKGPTMPFDGQQTSRVCFETGPVTSDVFVFGDGHCRLRREYRKGAAAGVVALQSGPVMWQRQGNGRWLRLPGVPATDVAAVASRVAANYRVTVGARTSMLGRSVTPLHIIAKATYNPSRRLWVDPASGLILKDELYAPGGRMRSSTAFVRLSLRPQPKALFTAPESMRKPDAFGPSSFQRLASRSDVERLSGRPILLPAHVPSGFRVELVGVMTTRNGRYMPAVRYSDGLAAFTIFQRGPGRGRGMGRGRGGGMGPRSGNGMHMEQSDLQRSIVVATGKQSNYLLVGDIAENELRRVADSLP